MDPGKRYETLGSEMKKFITAEQEAWTSAYLHQLLLSPCPMRTVQLRPGGCLHTHGRRIWASGSQVFYNRCDDLCPRKRACVYDTGQWAWLLFVPEQRPVSTSASKLCRKVRHPGITVSMLTSEEFSHKYTTMSAALINATNRSWIHICSIHFKQPLLKTINTIIKWSQLAGLTSTIPVCPQGLKPNWADPTGVYLRNQYRELSPSLRRRGRPPGSAPGAVRGPRSQRLGPVGFSPRSVLHDWVGSMAERLEMLLPFYDIRLESFYDLKVNRHFQRQTRVRSSLEIQFVFIYLFRLVSPPHAFAHSVSVSFGNLWRQNGGPSVLFPSCCASCPEQSLALRGWGAVKCR